MPKFVDPSAAPAAPETSTPQLIDCKTLAEIVNMHEFSIRRMVSQRRIPYFKIGTAVRFNQDEVLAFLHRDPQGGAR